MGGHVVVAFIVMQVTGAFAITVDRAFAVLRHKGIHPCLQVLENTRVSVFVDRQAGAGMQTGQVQHTLCDAGSSDPSVQRFVQPREARAFGWYLKLM
jgi:hypothetical protein